MDSIGEYGGTKGVLGVKTMAHMGFRVWRIREFGSRGLGVLGFS